MPPDEAHSDTLDQDHGGCRPPKALPPLAARAFGVTVQLQVTSDDYLRNDSYWRLQTIYEPALAAQTLAPTGTALDIGAGYGCFTLPFALANPGWIVWAFEPEPEAFAALRANIAAHQAANVIALNAAVTGTIADCDPAAIGRAIGSLTPANADALAALLALLPKQDFRRHVTMRGVVEFCAVTNAEFEALSLTCIPSEALLALNPGLLKLSAPLAEVAVLDGLTAAALDHVIGESWMHVPSDLVYRTAAGRRQTWLPRAGSPLLRLRRTAAQTGHRPGLDLVVAMYNSKDWITDCVTSLLTDDHDEIRVIVVDDGSTDGSRELVQDRFGSHDRVRLLTKANGGCASARNFGRMASSASHVGFIDADDMAGPGLFPALLDLARHTGAEMVQAGFELLVEAPDGGTNRLPTYEAALPELIAAQRHDLGNRTCIVAPSWLLTQGQPSIWRRIYRRDFLDNRDIWFPEHIRAFDDQYFQLVTLHHVPDVPMLEGVHYLYRQHPGQDIKQGDERHFYSLEMFRLVLKRGITEGWTEFRPLMASYVRTVNWAWHSLRPDLRPAFEQGAAELWAWAGLVLDPFAFDGTSDTHFAPPEFALVVRQFRDRLRLLDRSYGAVYLDSINMHPAMVHLHGGSASSP